MHFWDILLLRNNNQLKDNLSVIDHLLCENGKQETSHFYQILVLTTIARPAKSTDPQSSAEELGSPIQPRDCFSITVYQPSTHNQALNNAGLIITIWEWKLVSGIAKEGGKSVQDADSLGILARSLCNKTSLGCLIDVPLQIQSVFCCIYWRIPLSLYHVQGICTQ